MKNLRILLAVIVILAGSIGSAQAIPIAFPTNTVDFSGTGTDGVQTYFEVSYNDSGYGYSYTHTLGVLTPSALSLVSANLSITHKNNSNNSGETWFSYSGGDILIGQLSTSAAWYTDIWALPSTVLTEMASTNPWSLTVKLKETTTGTDKIWLDVSELSGTYEPAPIIIDPELNQNSVPEPATMSLLGIGLAGLVARRKKSV